MSSYWSQLIRSSGFWQKQRHHEVHSVAALELSTVSHSLPQEMELEHFKDFSFMLARDWKFSLDLRNSKKKNELPTFKPTWMRSKKKKKKSIFSWRLSKLHLLRKIMWYNWKLQNSYRVDLVVYRLVYFPTNLVTFKSAAFLCFARGVLHVVHKRRSIVGQSVFQVL